MKKILALLLMLALTLSLCACEFSMDFRPGDGTLNGDDTAEAGASNDEETQESDDASSDETPPTEEQGLAGQQFSNEAGTSIDVIREEIAQAGAVFGVAYLGSYFPGDMTYAEWFEFCARDLGAYYPFLLEIDEAHTIGTQGHLYCIVGGDYGDTITAQTLDGEVLYEAGHGDPILLFCSRDGEGMITDTIVSITTPDGTAYQWEARLDGANYPELLIGEERQLLSWDFTSAYEMTRFDFSGWLNEGWLGPLETSLAGTDVFEGMSWWIRTTDGTRLSYFLRFYPNAAHNYDGEVVLECFYGDDTTVQAEWQGWWYLETTMENASSLHLDLMLLNGADQEAFEASAVITEDYKVLLAPSGETLLLVADSLHPVLPLFPDGWRFAELSLVMG